MGKAKNPRRIRGSEFAAISAIVGVSTMECREALRIHPWSSKMLTTDYYSGLDRSVGRGLELQLLGNKKTSRGKRSCHGPLTVLSADTLLLGRESYLRVTGSQRPHGSHRDHGDRSEFQELLWLPRIPRTSWCANVFFRLLNIYFGHLWIMMMKMSHIISEKGRKTDEFGSKV